MIMGEGGNPSKNHLLKLAGTVGIKPEKALAATEKWHAFASDAGVSKVQTNHIGKAFARRLS
jgi:hypothetical protein